MDRPSRACRSYRARSRNYIVTKPNSTDAYSRLQQLSCRENDIPAYRDAMVKLCQRRLQAQDFEATLVDYDEHKNSDGEQLPWSTWVELCRATEAKEQFDRAGRV